MAKANVQSISDAAPSVRVAFTLEREPAKGGGVRYAADGRKDFTIYVPQDVLSGLRKAVGARFPQRIVLTVEN